MPQIQPKGRRHRKHQRSALGGLQRIVNWDAIRNDRAWAKTSGVPVMWYSFRMPSTKLRIQVTLDTELAAALTEFGSTEPRSRAVRDLALRGAEAIRTEQAGKRAALEHLHRIATGEDDRYDFSVSERLHAAR
jgi:hypothetical protein